METFMDEFLGEDSNYSITYKKAQGIPWGDSWDSKN